jgi:uncharacterized membrane protein YqhA
MKRSIEFLLWNVRLLMIVPVIVSVVLAAALLLITTIDAIALSGTMLSYATLDSAARSTAYVESIVAVVAIVDGYLLAAILIIFALGLYELFIDKIDYAEGSDLASRLLLIRSLDDLKDRLANLILVILIVKFFQIALKMKYTEPIDLLYLSIGMVLVGGSLYLTAKSKASKSSPITYSAAESPK